MCVFESLLLLLCVYFVDILIAGDMDVMKNSPANGRGTPRDDLSASSVTGQGDLNPYMGPPYQDGVS